MEVSNDDAVVAAENAGLVQPDWHLAVREGEDKFFVGLRPKSASAKTDFLNVCKTKDGSFGFEKYQEGISIDVQRQSVVLSSSSMSTTFLCPTSEIDVPHKSIAKSIDISCTGNLILMADNQAHLAVLNSMSGAKLREFEGHIMDVYKCVFFPSGLVVLSCGMDMTVRVWSVETGDCVRVFKGHTQAVVDISIIGAGREVLSCSKDGNLIKWSCADDKEVKRWSLESGPCTAMSSGKDHISKLCAVACEMKKVFVVDVESGEHLCSFSLNDIPTACSFDSSLDSVIYVGTENGTLSVYDMEKRCIIYSLRTARGAVMKILTREEGIFVSFNDGSVCIYSRTLETPSPTVEFTGADCDPVYDMCTYNKHLFTTCRDKIIRKYQIP